MGDITSGSNIFKHHDISRKRIGVLAIAIFFITTAVQGQSSSFDKVLDTFISEEYNPYHPHDDYMVFTVEVKGFDAETKDFCFKICYIYNSWDLKKFSNCKGIL